MGERRRFVVVAHQGTHTHFGTHVTSPSIIVKADLTTFTGIATATI
jgi:hypothetical protein